MGKNGFTLNANLCTGCSACEIACTIENELELGFSWRDISTYNPKKTTDLNHYHFSMACNHCEQPICADQCPAKAINKNEKTGIVDITYSKCIGCKFCSWVCPYDAPKYDSKNLTMTKCNFCSPRIENNLDPACVSVCPTGALIFENQHEEIPEPYLDFLDSNLKPAYKFIPREKYKNLPKRTTVYPEELNNLYNNKSSNTKISLKSEWSLAIFTFLIALIGGLFSCYLFGSPKLDPIFILVLGIIGTELSNLHLGKKSLAYRAISNWKTSWLSREVIGYSLFMIFMIIYFFVERYFLVGCIAMIFAIFTAYSADMLYNVTAKTAKLDHHSSQITLSLLLFVALFNNILILLIFILIVKFLFYYSRKLKKGFPFKSYIVTAIRILLGFVIPIFLLKDFNSKLDLYLYSSIVISELIDRFEFYYELKIKTPQSELDKLFLLS